MRPYIRILLCALAALVTLELAARIDDWIAYRAPFLSSYDVNALYSIEDGVIRGKPHARFKNWQLNSLGLRGPELHAGKTRVLCIGASETFGMLESSGREFPRQLESVLNSDRSTARYEVVNLSYFGLRLSTANVLLPKLLDTVNPQVAIIYLTYGGYVAKRTAVSTEETLPNPTFSLRIIGKAVEFARKVVPQPIQNRVKHWWMNRYVGGRELIVSTPPDRLDALSTDLIATVHLLRKHGVEPVIVTHANRFTEANDPYRQDMLIAWRRFYPLVSEAGLLDMDKRLNEAAREVAATEKVTLIDAESLMPGGGLNFTDHTHFTEAGAQTLAKIIAKGIEPSLNASRRTAAEAASTAP